MAPVKDPKRRHVGLSLQKQKRHVENARTQTLKPRSTNTNRYAMDLAPLPSAVTWVLFSYCRSPAGAR